ncbi:hypothetical protein QYF61_011150 [Mycteria americana]|uniref:Thioredoxin reductase 1, cytoplasmic n=1 Tax=Mycteria americana TaxID=33587 RepID=A0AAN7NRS6_MYCAM|nr:hypothetical protein QYF61_011150 [Mycteria americana]
MNLSLLFLTVTHNWMTMTESVQNYIGSLNWGYRVALREKKVTYENAYGEFVGPHTVKVLPSHATNKRGVEKLYTAERFLIATGERPRYLGIPGDKEYCISSDDLFSLPYCPGKTLVVGASYVALECAGFLAGLGLDVTVMVRSILLRGFDQDIANKIGEYMEEHGISFIREFVPIKVEQIEEGTPGRLKVIAKSTKENQIIEGEYNTVLLAIGRDACTRKIGLDKVGVKINEKTGKIPVNDEEQTNVPYIYAVGDILQDKLELTPVAIQAGRLLVQRLYAGATTKTYWRPVTRDVPQGWILSPVLFNIFINDLDDETEYTLSKFADDNWGEVTDAPDGCAFTQRDLIRLEKWADRNLAEFGKEKCKVLRLGRCNPMHQHRLGTHQLESSCAEKASGGLKDKLTCDYVNVPTTVFTPLEYGACGYSEETAVEKFGEENIEVNALVYHSHFWPLEWTVPSRDNNKCYAKIICNIQDNERVIGFHVLGPNAGEVTQGFAAAIKCGLTKEQLDSTIGIHPVCAEVCI